MNNNDFLQKYGPVAVITGASSGIGASFAANLAAKGFDLVLVARRNDRLQQLADSLYQQYQTGVTVVQADLASADASEQILAATRELDTGLLICNAGFGYKGHFTHGDPQLMSAMLQVNCHSPMALAQGFLPRLQARGRGGVIFTASVEGLLGCPYSAVYSASKGFLVNLGEALWAEYAADPIDILTLCPGATDTEAPAKQGIDPATLSNLMSPEDVAQLTLENITNGPVYIPSDHYRQSFEQLLSLPRAQALQAMAAGMKPGSGR
ncbi:SDR family oxidoreductase [Pseudomaricurvus sp. HS19]|uniref:SDR family NAD(P)-dependent oxidoreductase n=1 Tax=Pseudomaricurvus sp. HS19 TaxID=2692626 RepID=UPI00136D3BE8|nr:SDR family NAD(P)-dependent oxidoreductase [Pseudomaricurvus sp. HS19]MYM62619.1 SDR family NAD(P)-dependent oxidoreductase [Pseudomaricurvus sp. HS19]